MEKWGRIFIATLLHCYIATLFPSSSFAQTRAKFGSHLAAFNSPEMIESLRVEYDKVGVYEWIPVTVMIRTDDSPQVLEQFLTACQKNKIWPILRLDKKIYDETAKDEVSGQRIEKQDVDRVVQSLNQVSALAEKFPWPIYIEFANEPNMDREWKPKLDPASYTVSLRAFIEKVPSPFKVLNGAMNISAPDGEETMDAEAFWNRGPKDLVGALDGLAFNPYEGIPVDARWDPRRGIINSWQWEWELLGSPPKPLFLLEFGLNSEKSLKDREEFLEGEYQAYLNGERPQFDQVKAITPLFCLEGCTRFKIPVFYPDGRVDLLDPVGGTSLEGGEEEEEEEERECGKPGAITTIEQAAGTEDCFEEVLRPAGLRPQKNDWWLCRLSGAPIIGSLIRTACLLRIDSGEVYTYVGPYQAQKPPEPPPEVGAAVPAGLTQTTSESQVLGVSDSIIGWLLRLIAGFTIKREKAGHIAGALPSQLEAAKSNSDETRATAAQEEEGLEEKIIHGFDTLKRAYTPYALQERSKPPGVPLPSELEPGSTPGEPGELWYTIRYRDSSIDVSAAKKAEIVEKVMGYWPNSKIQDEWEYVEGKAKGNGWNPAFVIALWIEESGASGVHAWDVGCTGADQDNLSKGLDCLFGLYYAGKPFPEFLCRFSEGHYPCTFSINPNFPKNLKVWYDNLIPAGTPGAAEPL